MLLALRGHSFTRLTTPGTNITLTLQGEWILNDLLVAWIGHSTAGGNAGDTSIPAPFGLMFNDQAGATGPIIASYSAIPAATPAASFTWVKGVADLWFGGIAIYGPASPIAQPNSSIAFFPAGACGAPPQANLAGAGAGFGAGDSVVAFSSYGTPESTPLNLSTDFVLGSPGPSNQGIGIARFPHVAGVADPTFGFTLDKGQSGSCIAFFARLYFFSLGSPPPGGTPNAFFGVAGGHWPRRNTRMNPTGGEPYDLGPRTGRHFYRSPSGLWLKDR